MPRPFIKAPKTASVALIYNVDTFICENIFHIEALDDFTYQDCLSTWELVYAWWGEFWRRDLPQGCESVGLEVKALHDQIAPIYTRPPDPPINGAYGGYLLPRNASFAVRFDTGLTGRSQHGRLYIPCLSTEMCTDNSHSHISQATAEAWCDKLDTLQLQFRTYDIDIVVTSYRTNNAWREIASNSEVIGFSYYNLLVDSQRRRLHPNP